MNKISKKIKESKINFVSLSKYFLITLAMLLIAGGVIILTLGFNLGFEYGGGTIVEVVYDVDVDGTIYTEKQVKDIIDIAIVDYGLKTSSVQKEESSFGDRVAYKLTSKTRLDENSIDRLNNDLFTMLGSYDEADIIQSQYVKVYNVNGVVGKKVSNAAIAISVAIILVFVGVLIRYGLSQAFSLSLMLILNIFVMISVAALSRIPLNTAFVASVFTTFFLTIMGALIIFDNIRKNNNIDYKDSDKSEYINTAIKEVFIILVMLFVFALITSVLVSGLGIISIRSFGIPAVFGSILSIMSAMLGLPLLYSNITFKKINKK